MHGVGSPSSLSHPSLVRDVLSSPMNSTGGKNEHWLELPDWQTLVGGSLASEAENLERFRCHTPVQISILSFPYWIHVPCTSVRNALLAFAVPLWGPISDKCLHLHAYCHQGNTQSDTQSVRSLTS